jgi:hypothetical protein
VLRGSAGTDRGGSTPIVRIHALADLGPPRLSASGDERTSGNLRPHQSGGRADSQRCSETVSSWTEKCNPPIVLTKRPA